MKIGILTLPLHTNYGGILQAWALQTCLEKLGHEAEHVMRKMQALMPWDQDLATKQFINAPTGRFIDRYIHGHDVLDPSWVRPGDYEAFVVGSDQIWRHFYADYMMGWPNAFLAFADGWDVRRVSYAASFGLDSWEAPADTIPLIRRLIQQFDAVSVRESSGVDLCREMLGVAAAHVADPTLLLDREDYLPLVDDAPDLQPLAGDMLCYVLDENPEKKQFIDTLATRFSLHPFRTNSHVEDIHAPLADRIQQPVEQWLKSFRDSRFVITDSFHATVFSILFRKPFVVTGNPQRGLARLQSLLASLGLEDHLVISAEDVNPQSDYSIPEAAYTRLATLRDTSRAFLEQALYPCDLPPINNSKPLAVR